MHPQAFDFVRRVVQSLPPLRAVAEFGSREHNGSVREVFTDARGGGGFYVGIDLHPGPGADVVMDAADWDGRGMFDACVCCEVFEHAPKAAGLCRSAFRALRPGGFFVATCAGPGREPHGADGGPLREGEFYENCSADHLNYLLEEAGFDVVLMPHQPQPGDLYALALKAR